MSKRARVSLSRRAAMGTMAAASLGVGAGIARSMHVAPSGKQPTAFALVGDRFHNPEYIRPVLEKIIEQGTGVHVDFMTDVRLLSADNLQGYKLLILLREGFIWPNGYDQVDVQVQSVPPLPERDMKPRHFITADQGKAVKAFVENGGGILFYHNSSHISLGNRDYRDVMGGAFLSHPVVRPFKVEITNKNHPITRGVNDFQITDEQHFVEYDKDPKYVLMRSVNVDGLTHKDYGTSCAAGWAYDYGKGGVCFLAPGHLASGLWNPEYVKLQQNAVRWLLREL